MEKGVNNDEITKGDKTIVIPGLALFIGALVVDNIVANVCKASTVTKLLKAEKKNEKES